MTEDEDYRYGVRKVRKSSSTPTPDAMFSGRFPDFPECLWWGFTMLGFDTAGRNTFGWSPRLSGMSASNRCLSRRKQRSVRMAEDEDMNHFDAVIIGSGQSGTFARGWVGQSRAIRCPDRGRQAGRDMRQ